MAAAGPTIFALSSGAPPAAIGVIRISGPRAGAALAAMHGTLPPPRRATLGWLADPRSGERLDRALLLWFPGPHSATGEDLAELHVHGGRAVTRTVLDALASIDGLRAAEGGEFTRAAFANGVIDLAQAEGLADLIAAETEAQRRSAQHMAGGALGRRVAAWQDQILELSARIEAMIDFADDDGVEPALGPVNDAIAQLATEQRALLELPPAERLREGVRVVLAGPPNAGKSTLLNAIAGREAAIVAEIPGTTRDVIEVPLSLGGVPFLFVDTAGLRDGGDIVERIGIGRAHHAIDGADILLWLGAVEDAPTRPETIILYPRCDERSRREAPPEPDHFVSAVTGEGMGPLLAAIIAVGRRLIPRPGDMALNSRQRSAVWDCLAALDNASSAQDAVLAAEWMRRGRDALDRLTGRSGTEEMLDALFGRFCIGK